MTETVANICPSLNARAVKIFFKDEIRRFSFTGSSFYELRAALKQLLAISNDNFAIRYQDDEGDWVTITSDSEMQYAFQLVNAQALRLKIEDKPAMNVPSLVPAEGAPKIVTPPLSPKDMWREVKNAKKEFKEAKKYEKYQNKAAKMESKIQKKMDANHPNLVARFVNHITVEDNYEFAAGTAFTKTWRFRNEGIIPWPQNAILLFVGKKGDQMGAPNFVTIPKVVLPGEEIDVSVPMVAPSAPGSYFGYWRLAEFDGRKFGQRVRVLIKVAGDSTSSEESSPVSSPFSWGHMLTQLESMGFKDKGKNVKLLVKTHGDLDKVIAKLLKKEEKKSGVRKHH
jgi:hypothetical protein